MSALRLARRLQWATIVWNCVEVFITIALGIAARSLALVAFGLDSLIEVFAGLVVLWSLHPEPVDGHRIRDRRAEMLVAASFAVLAAFLLVTAMRSLIVGTEPESSPVGVVYLAATAAVMFTLAEAKRRVSARIGSEPFRAEAMLTFLDGGLALGILTALVVNAWWGWWWADALAALLVGAIAAAEAVEGLRAGSTDRAPSASG
ncbi:MAG: cation transporter [Acidimicrobiales bacterium]